MDLTEEMLAKCRDCPSEINGVKIEFYCPQMNIEHIDMHRLCSGEVYNNTFSPFAALAYGLQV